MVYSRSSAGSLAQGLAALLLVAVTACGAASRNAPARAGSASAERDEAIAGLEQLHRYHHHGGVTLFIAMSLDTLGASPEQEAALQQVRADLHSRMEPARAAEQGLARLLADEVSGQALDSAKVDAAVAQVAASAGVVHEASVDALNQLHRLLTPPQRAALVQKVEAHWTVWQYVNAEAGERTEARSARVAALVDDFDLSTEQAAGVLAGMARRTGFAAQLDALEVDARLRAFGDAFRAESFDARALGGAGPSDARVAAWGAANMARLVESVSPALAPEPRARLARQLREHATHDPTVEERQ